ncbi:MAG: hypothetical protein A2666_04250 [Parcubacteria group bacterium RIFCSPHIGHO2_01_FULL_47_10b]|nr:MAG: hypothetical protein A2666_04250 [Parcubacteria group bacterium RIFCSPHIGHO2_01_FULL_47_10b]
MPLKEDNIGGERKPVTPEASQAATYLKALANGQEQFDTGVGSKEDVNSLFSDILRKEIGKYSDGDRPSFVSEGQAFEEFKRRCVVDKDYFLKELGKYLLDKVAELAPVGYLMSSKSPNLETQRGLKELAQRTAQSMYDVFRFEDDPSSMGRVYGFRPLEGEFEPFAIKYRSGGLALRGPNLKGTLKTFADNLKRTSREAPTQNP